MEESYIQATRAMSVTTPLGKDVLLLVGFTGSEAVSQLFHFQLELLAENGKPVPFDKLLGQPVSIHLTLPDNESVRHIHGLCCRVKEGGMGDVFTEYFLEIVPQFWLLTRRAQSRIFQQVSVKDILKKVLEGMEVSYELQGTYEPRDYCVQYRETDFNFASRLMEEEGIYYFFKHAADGHTMVVSDTPQSHPDMPFLNKIIYETKEGGVREAERISSWEKIQELRSGQYTLWDHSFELPHQHLPAKETILPSLNVGDVTHKMQLGVNESLEIYDYPGEYAQRFDGVTPGGGDRSSDLTKIFSDNIRTVKIRMQQETVPGLTVHGTSDCRNLVSGYKFTLERHFNADGQYLTTSLSHTGYLTGDYRSGGESEFHYQNTFTCIPFALAFRPPRMTPKPAVQGTQTAVVVGPPGEEIFTDRYGRIKVQFHWDREGEYNDKSSCWVRVATDWAGKNWGIIHIPRIGQEVVVDFLEGDPDRPLVVGSVYNADTLPAYTLPDNKSRSGIKTYSTPGGGGFNEIRFEDKKGSEQIFINAQKDLDVRVQNDWRDITNRDRHTIVDRDLRKYVKRDNHVMIDRHLVESVKEDHHLKIGQKEAVEIGDSQSVVVKGDVIHNFRSNHSEEVGSEYYLKAKRVVIEGMTELCLKVGNNHITITTSGLTICGLPAVNLNPIPPPPPVMTKAGSPVPPPDPDEAMIADHDFPGKEIPTYKNQIAKMTPLQKMVYEAPAEGAPGTQERTSWIAVQMVNEAGGAVPGQGFTLIFSDNTTYRGSTDEKGECKVACPPGTTKIIWDLDQDAVEEA